jgi:hypothetical protein
MDRSKRHAVLVTEIEVAAAAATVISAAAVAQYILDSMS